MADLEKRPDRRRAGPRVDVFLQKEERRSKDSKLRLLGKAMSADAAYHCRQAINLSDIGGVEARVIHLGKFRFIVEVVFDNETSEAEFKWLITNRGPMATYRFVFLKRKVDLHSDSEVDVIKL